MASHADSQTRRKRRESTPEPTRIQDQPAPSEGQIMRFGDLKDLIGIALCDAMMLKKVHEQMALSKAEADWEYVKDKVEYCELELSEDKYGQKTTCIWKEMLGIEAPPYSQMKEGMPDLPAMSAQKLGTADPRVFAEAASEGHSALLHLANLAADWGAAPPVQTDPAKRVKGKNEDEGSESTARSQSCTVFLASLAGGRKRKDPETLVVDKETYVSEDGLLPYCAQLLQTRLIARLYAITACNTELAKEGRLTEKQFDLLKSLFPFPPGVVGITLATGLITRELDAGAPLPVPFKNRNSFKESMLRIAHDWDDWDDLKESGNKLLESFLSAVFAIPKLEFPADAAESS